MCTGSTGNLKETIYPDEILNANQYKRTESGDIRWSGGVLVAAKCAGEDTGATAMGYISKCVYIGLLLF